MISKSGGQRRFISIKSLPRIVHRKAQTSSRPRQTRTPRFQLRSFRKAGTRISKPDPKFHPELRGQKQDVEQDLKKSSDLPKRFRQTSSRRRCSRQRFRHSPTRTSLSRRMTSRMLQSSYSQRHLFLNRTRLVIKWRRLVVTFFH